MSSNAPLMPLPKTVSSPSSDGVRNTQRRMVRASPSPTAPLKTAISTFESAP